MGLAKKGDLAGGRSEEKIAKALQEWEVMNMVERSELVRVAKIEKFYKQEHSRLVLCFATRPERRHIIDRLVRVGASWKQGRPPKGAMERSLEGWLGELLC